MHRYATCDQEYQALTRDCSPMYWRDTVPPQWRRNRGFRRFNEPEPPSYRGPRVVEPQKNFRQDSYENH